MRVASLDSCDDVRRNMLPRTSLTSTLQQGIISAEIQQVFFVGFFDESGVRQELA